MAKNINRKVTIYINGKEVENTLKGLRGELKRLENEQKNAIIGTEAYVKTGEKIEELKKYIKNHTGSLKEVEKGWGDTAEALAKYSNILMGVQSAFQMVDLGVGKLKDLAKDAAALDDVYADVQKTTGLTHEQVEKLNEAFKKMDTRTSREQLNQLAYEAGKLGIDSAEAVAQFVSASDKINIALGDVLGEGAMVTVGKLTNIYEGVSKTLEGKNLEEKMLAIGSAVNSLGQASTANEGYMVEFMKRLGGIAAQAGMSADQVLGYASALDQNGQAVEMSATAFMKLIQQMVKKPEEFVQAAGVSIDEFRRMMDEDMNGAVLRTLEGMEKGGGFQQLIGMFADMGLDGARAATVVSSLAKHLDQVREAQALANQEMQTGTSVINEFNTKNETMQAQAEKAKKRFEEVRIELGNELYPVLIHLQKSGTVLMKGFAGWVQLINEHPGLLLTIAAALAAWNKERIVSAALWIKERPVAIAEWWQRRQNHKAILDETAASARQRVEQAKALQERIKERIAIQESVLARRQELIATGQGNQVLRAEATLRRLKIAQTKADTMATEAATAATKASAAAMNKIPLMFLITALTTLGTKLWEVWKHGQRVNEEERETNRVIGEQTSEATYLFDRLEKVTKGSTEYYSILNKLNELYPDIISKYRNEKGELDQVAAARQRVIDKIRQQVVEQRRLDKLSEISGDFADEQNEALEMMQEYMTRKFGKKKGQSMYEKFVSFLPQGFDEKADYSALRKKYEELSGEDMGMMFGWNKMYRALGKYTNAVNEAYGETEKFESLYSSMGSKGDDPFSLAGKSAEQLQTELTAAERRLAEYEKRKNAGKSQYDATDYVKMYDDEKKHVDALKAAISELNKEKAGGGDGGGTTGGSTYDGGETEKERKAREREEKAWNTFSQNYEQVMAKITARTLTGVEKINAEVDASIMKMRQELENVDKTVHPEAVENLERLVEQAERWKAAKIDEYLTKTQAEIDKLRKSTAKQGNGEQVDKAAKAVEELRQKISGIDDELMKLYADRAALFPMTDKASRRQLHDVNKRIAAYRELRNIIAASVFASIDTSVKNPFEKAIDQDEDKGNFSFTKARKKAMAEVAKQVEEYTKKLDDAIAAEVLMEQAARKSGDVDEAERHRKNTEALREQKAELDEVAEGEQTVKEKAEELAKSKAFRSTLQNWGDAVDEFGSKALSVFSNINTLLKNIADSRLQQLERERDAEIETLDEQLEQNLISQEDYESRKKELEDNYKDKADEAALEAWRREKLLGASEATIAAAVATMKIWAGEGTTAYKIAMSTLMAAEFAAQLLAIKNEPEPYARGGYVPRRTVYQAGEAGPEWVASNRLLEDPVAGPVIEQLEAYQRGNHRALADVPMAQLNMPVATRAARELGRRRSLSEGRLSEALPAINPNVSVTMPQNEEVVQLWRELAAYLKDPKNRQAVISRQRMKDFDQQEQFLRNRAQL